MLSRLGVMAPAEAGHLWRALIAFALLACSLAAEAATPPPSLYRLSVKGRGCGTGGMLSVSECSGGNRLSLRPSDGSLQQLWQLDVTDTGLVTLQAVARSTEPNKCSRFVASSLACGPSAGRLSAAGNSNATQWKIEPSKTMQGAFTISLQARTGCQRRYLGAWKSCAKTKLALFSSDNNAELLNWAFIKEPTAAAVPTGKAVARKPPPMSAGDAASRKPSQPSKGKAPKPKLPAVPAWVKMGRQREESQQQYEANLAAVAAADKAGQQFDLILYGDSIVRYIKDYRAQAWDLYFRQYKAEPFPMAGSTVQELAYRIVKGGEKPKKDPKVAVLMGGIINLKYADVLVGPLFDGEAWQLMEWLVKWMRAAMPNSKIVLLAMLPNTVVDVAPTNTQYKALAARQNATYLDCGKGIDPKDTNMLKDGTHPAVGGQRVVAKCLHDLVAPWLK